MPWKSEAAHDKRRKCGCRISRIGKGGGSELTIFREQTRECLELLRALVGLLVNKPEREGPGDCSG